MIKTFYYNKRAIFILFIINFVLLVMLFASFTLIVDDKAIVVLYSLVSMIVTIAFIQLIVFCFSYGKVIFSRYGIELFGRFSKKISWYEVKGIYYCDFFIIADNNCLEIWVQNGNDTVQLFEKKDVKIFCTKKKYRNIIKLVPDDLIEANQFLFYSNLKSKMKDEHNIYK